MLVRALICCDVVSGCDSGCVGGRVVIVSGMVWWRVCSVVAVVMVVEMCCA